MTVRTEAFLESNGKIPTDLLGLSTLDDEFSESTFEARLGDLLSNDLCELIIVLGDMSFIQSGELSSAWQTDFCGVALARLGEEAIMYEILGLNVRSLP